jgi:uncharacterized RDD family membrane protein YckC
MSVDGHAAALAERLAGSAIDAVVIVAGGSASYLVLTNAGGEALALTFALAYLTLPVACFGRTLGKVVAGTRVVHARDGRRPSLRQAFERSALLALPPAVFLVTLPFVAPLTNLYAFQIGVITAAIYMSGLVRDDHAGWHDVYAETVVVKS